MEEIYSGFLYDMDYLPMRMVEIGKLYNKAAIEREEPLKQEPVQRRKMMGRKNA